MPGQSNVQLSWLGKNNRRSIPSCRLQEIPENTSPPGNRFENMLIYGDNLLALKALEPDFHERIKCIYIDPPYNSGAALAHYDDGLEHAAWLTMMRDRLALLRVLLRDDGVIFVSIDDSELAYLTILLDEIFGRENSCGMFVWEKKKKPSFLNTNMGMITEYILAYAKDRAQSPPFIGGTTTPGKKFPLNNAGNGIRILTFPPNSVKFRCEDQRIEPQDMSEGNIVTELLDSVEIKDGHNANAFRLRGEWRYSQATLDELLRAGESFVISKVPFRPNHIKAGGEPKKLKNLFTIDSGMSTYEDATAESRALFGSNAFDYPKPEKLIHTLLAAVTQPGDWVLDSFAGSGTTGAVAHKMSRKWLMVEQGEHCQTHIVPRMKKVIDGTDTGGVTALTNWRGGGGFRQFSILGK